MGHPEAAVWADTPVDTDEQTVPRTDRPATLRSVARRESNASLFTVSLT